MDNATFVKYIQDNKTFQDQKRQKFMEFERIALGYPSKVSSDETGSEISDKTASSILKKTKQRVVQTTPTGEVKSSNPILSIVSDDIIQNKIIRSKRAFTSKIRRAFSCAGKVGIVFTYLVRTDDGIEVKVADWRDVLLERDISSAFDCSRILIREWWSDEQLDKVISNKDADTDDGWDIKELENLRNVKTSQTWIDERLKNQKDGVVFQGIEIFNEYYKGGFCTYAGFTKTKLREVKFRDESIWATHFFYYDEEGGDVYGSGLIEGLADVQNMLDAQIQGVSVMSDLMKAPPVKTKGGVDKKTIVYKKNAIWDMGDDPSADASPVDLTTFAMRDFRNERMMYQSQMYGQAGGTDATDIPSGVDINQGKTPQALKQQSQTLGVNDATLRGNIEQWFECCMQDALKLYFESIEQGVVAYELDDEHARAIRFIAEGMGIDDILDGNTITLDNSELENFKFIVESGSSIEVKAEDKYDKLRQLLSDIATTPMANVVDPRFINGALRQATDALGLDYEQIIGYADDQITTPTTNPDPNAGMQGQIPMGMEQDNINEQMPAGDVLGAMA